MSLKKKRIRIAIIDDHPILREGMAVFLNQQNDIEIVGEAETASQAVDLVERLKPEAIFLDISLKDSNGIDAIKSLKAVSPQLRILVLSMHDESIYAPRALRAGALGYVMKHESPETMLAALRKVIQGEIYVSAAMSTQMLNDLARGTPIARNSPVELLSNRQFEVLILIGKGFGTKQIAEQLNLGVKTIESHRTHIKRKLGLETGTQLVHYAIKWIETGDFLSIA
ncbi:MAG: two component transcriptional regulator, LuxR family [Verrucomicrobiales bacterium]|nr:two component transcriptional regulator, LuxR family [Verrucomicrobiales bacterium]